MLKLPLLTVDIVWTVLDNLVATCVQTVQNYKLTHTHEIQNSSNTLCIPRSTHSLPTRIFDQITGRTGWLCTLST